MKFHCTAVTLWDPFQFFLSIFSSVNFISIFLLKLKEVFFCCRLCHFVHLVLLGLQQNLSKGHNGKNLHSRDEKFADPIVLVNTFLTSVIGTPLHYSKNCWSKMPAVQKVFTAMEPLYNRHHWVKDIQVSLFKIIRFSLVNAQTPYQLIGYGIM